MATLARQVFVSGSVQGVGFRHYAKLRARELELVGWVQNLSDGRVETWIEGPAARVEAMQAWLTHGPPSARVAHVEVHERTPEGFARFEVRR